MGHELTEIGPIPLRGRTLTLFRSWTHRHIVMRIIEHDKANLCRFTKWRRADPPKKNQAHLNRRNQVTIMSKEQKTGGGRVLHIYSARIKPEQVV